MIHILTYDILPIEIKSNQYSSNCIDKKLIINWKKFWAKRVCNNASVTCYNPAHH